MDTNENIINKLEYIGLNFDDIPDAIRNFKPLDYRPSKYDDEHTYKVYKYVNVGDIQILLTKTNRLCDIREKYKKAVPLYEYLTPNKEENIERHTKFLSMVANMDIDKITKIEEEQKVLNERIPFMVKYPKDYLWQIYYSEYTNQYFMLVPTEDLEYSAFFYILKKQLEKDYDQKIFVPISYMDYSSEYLSRMQITDIENYLWLFTKEWPLVYEIYDKQGNMNIQITGKVYVYDDIQSDYNIKLKSKEEAIKFYKLLKALFIIQTEIPHRYKFNLSINEKGSIDFNINNKKIIYEILSSFIKEEYLKAEEKNIGLISEKEKKKIELERLKIKSNSLEKEYLDKQREISTFLVCRKTFLGRVKYFFRYKKSESKNVENTDKIADDNKDKKEIRINQYKEIKEFYTIEELMELYKEIDKEEIRVKSINLDIKAIKQRIKNLEAKIKNASLYIKEIDEHKKSIFEFWKFTNKDKQNELPEGEIEQEQRISLKKVFNYELDFEDLAKQLDKKQREELTQTEINSIYIATTNIMQDINTVARGEKTSKVRLEEIKEEASKEKILFENEPFDIFGAIESNDNYIKILANKKHRETKKELFRILDISQNTTVEEYEETIRKIVNDIKNAIKKIKIGVQISVYKEAKNLDKFNIFRINPEDAITKFKNSKEKETNLYKINLKEDNKVLALTNIIYYFNSNKTLPLGMDVEEGLILNIDKTKEKLEEEKIISIVCYEDQNDEMSKVIIKKLHIKRLNI